jgi:hypothetical protein
LIAELSPLTLRVMIERYLLILVSVASPAPQIETRVDYSLLLTLFSCKFCWFTELIMLATFLGSCVCDRFSCFSM